jgi:hypothetical protein
MRQKSKSIFDNFMADKEVARFTFLQLKLGLVNENKEWGD